jgi:xanthine dehydrogenase accessory factor
MRAMLREMLQLTERRSAFAVCTVVQTEGSVPGKVGSVMIVTLDGSARGTVGGAGLEEKVKAAAVQALKTGDGGLQTFDLAKWKPEGLNSICGGTVTVSILVHRPLPHLLLYGGGHCGKALADMAAVLDWDVTVIDPRGEYANPERFPHAVETIDGDPVAWTRTADLGSYTHAYLLGHSWEIDVDVLAALLPRFPRFVGAIGSQSKRHHIHQELRKRGIPARDIERLVCPIGTDIGAEAPEEIAVAVAAEVISTLKRSDEKAVQANA